MQFAGLGNKSKLEGIAQRLSADRRMENCNIKGVLELVAFPQ